MSLFATFTLIYVRSLNRASVFIIMVGHLCFRGTNKLNYKAEEADVSLPFISYPSWLLATPVRTNSKANLNSNGDKASHCETMDFYLKQAYFEGKPMRDRKS